MAEISSFTKYILKDSNEKVPGWATPEASLKVILAIQYYNYAMGNCAFGFTITPRVIFIYWLMVFPNNKDLQSAKKAFGRPEIQQRLIINPVGSTIDFTYPEFYMQLTRNSINTSKEEECRLWEVGIEELIKLVPSRDTYTAYVLSDKVPRSKEEFKDTKHLGINNFAAYGFAKYCRDNKIGIISASTPIINQSHSFAESLSMSQVWLWIPPKSIPFLFRNPQGDFKQELPEYPSYSKSVRGVIDKSAKEMLFL